MSWKTLAKSPKLFAATSNGSHIHLSPGEAEEGLPEYAGDTLKQYGWEKKGS